MRWFLRFFFRFSCSERVTVHLKEENKIETKSDAKHFVLPCD